MWLKLVSGFIAVSLAGQGRSTLRSSRLSHRLRSATARLRYRPGAAFPCSAGAQRGSRDVAQRRRLQSIARQLSAHQRTAGHRTAPHVTAHERTAPHSTAPHRTSAHSTAQYRISPQSTAHHYTSLHPTAHHHIVLCAVRILTQCSQCKNI